MLVQVALYSALAYLLAGPMLLTRLGLEEPRLLAEARDAKLGLMIAFFVANAVASSLATTGAYEVTLALHGAPPLLLHSKLASGGVPSVASLVQACIAAGLVPDAAAAAHFGLAQ